MKRVAFMISSLDLGGAQRAVSSVTMSLPSNYDIDIILNDDSNVLYPYNGKIYSLGIKNPKDRTNIFFQLRVFVRRIAYLRKIKKETKYSSFVSFLDSANVANILTGNKYSKTIISVRVNLSEDKNWKYKLIVNNLVRLFYNKADYIVALSEGVRRDLIDNFNLREDKVITIYNGYDIENIRLRGSEECPLSIDSSKLNFITMGRLTYQKGQWHLIRAFAELYKTYKDIRLYILGVGELEGYLRNMIHDNNLDDAVFLTGFIDNSYAALSKMDVFVFPSLYEGFGNALVEAMSCGLPCISTDYKSGAREILMDNIDQTVEQMKLTDYGIIVPNMSGEKNTATQELDAAELELKKAMEILINDEDIRRTYSEKSIERADFFSLTRMGKEWDEII